jgi:hypothetical protein
MGLYGLPRTSSRRGVRPRTVAWLTIVGLLSIAAIFFGGDAVRWVFGQRDGGLATLVGRDLLFIRAQVERFVADRGAVQALTPAAFADVRPGAAGVFDRLRTGSGPPVPPPKVFEPGTRAARPYALEVNDTTGGRGPVRVVVLRGVRESVCREFNAHLSKPVNPFEVDRADRYARGKGCISDPDTGEFVIFDVLYSS